MIWEQAVLTFGAFVFSLALLPSIFSEHKPDLRTSLITGSVLLSFTVAYISLGFFFTATTIFVNGVLWFVLAAQTIRKQKKEE